MKFYQVAVGERFIFKGDIYMKASPVLASHEETGRQCFMRRADSVQSCMSDVQQAAAYDKKAFTDARLLLARVDTFIETSIHSIDASIEGLTGAQKQAIAKLLRGHGEDLKKGLKRYKK